MVFRILVCDDDKDIVSAIEIYLRSEGFEVYCAHNGLQALDILRQQDIQLVILDIMMPEMDGLRATIKIREQNNIPIILLSARSEDADKVLGLNVGADDYMTKPFNPIELMARVRSHLRRYTSFGGLPLPHSTLRIGGLMLDDVSKRFTVDDRDVALTPNEYGIMHLLMSHPSQVFSSEQIYNQVWGEKAFDVKKTISVHISHLREKIEVNPKEPNYIKVVYGMGYKLVGGRS